MQGQVDRPTIIQRPQRGIASLGQCVLALSLLLAPTAAFSQQPTTPATNRSQPSPEQLRRFAANFQANVQQGCLRTPPKRINARTFCSCYASSFLRRFTPADLAVINNFASKSSQGIDLVTVMMSPERRACAAAASQR